MDTGENTRLDVLERRVLELERDKEVLQQELRNAREIINDSDPDFYGDNLPAELVDENEFNEEVRGAY